MKEENKEFNTQFIIFGLASLIFYIWGRFTGGIFEETFLFFAALCLAFCVITLALSIVIWLIPENNQKSNTQV